MAPVGSARSYVAGGAGGGYGGAYGGSGTSGAAEADMGCYQVCFEGDPSAVQTSERWAYVGEGRGSYSQETSVEYVGSGKGNLEKQAAVSYGSWRLRSCCIGLTSLLLMLGLGYLLWRFWPQADMADDTFSCVEGFHDWQNLWTQAKKDYCCDTYGRGCPAHSPKTKVVYHKVNVPVPSPSRVIHVPVHMRPETHVVYKTHYVHEAPHVIYQPAPQPAFHYDCHAAFNNWYFAWSASKKSWCCDHMQMGCPGSWHGSYQIHTHVFSAGVGHQHGRIYDCAAGFSNWLQGWSDSKKDWCCHKQSKGCVKFHCTAGSADMWGADKRSWCCSNFQKGCPHTTLSALKCDAQCHHAGETRSCHERIQWTKEHVFGNQGNGCSLAYSRVQVECDICRACSIQEAGCEVHAVGKDPFDCNAALNNFFRAWSPEKKHWCCTKQGKGCEGSTAPTVDPGYGMMWKHVQVNGYWTWQTVHAAGGVHTKLPYDCHAGLGNFERGWSAPKKSWCCSNQHLGCPGSGAGAAGAAGGAAGGEFHSSHSYHSSGSYHSGGSYHSSGAYSGGHHHVVVVHHYH